MSNRAWVTLATNDSYGLGALVLAHSLRRVGSTIPAVVLVTPSLTDAMRDRLSAVFSEVITVNVLDSQDATHLAMLQRPELGITFTKIHCWNLTQYEKCVFLDADTLVIQNCDELFEREELSAAPDVGWPDCFNSGVFVFRPSADTFSRLITFAQERGSFDGGDQGLLNSFFSDWAHGDISKHLPFLYNVTSAAFYSYIPALKHYGQNLKIIHFIGMGKPWLQQYNWDTNSVTAPEHLKEFLQLWWDIFVGQVHQQLDTSMVENEQRVTEAPPELPPQDALEYYAPTLDPESEFPWHHPDEQVIQAEENTYQLDMSQFYDPWEHRKGDIPPGAQNENIDQSRQFWEQQHYTQPEQTHQLYEFSSMDKRQSENPERTHLYHGDHGSHWNFSSNDNHQQCHTSQGQDNQYDRHQSNLHIYRQTSRDNQESRQVNYNQEVQTHEHYSEHVQSHSQHPQLHPHQYHVTTSSNNQLNEHHYYQEHSYELHNHDHQKHTHDNNDHGNQYHYPQTDCSSHLQEIPHNPHNNPVVDLSKHEHTSEYDHSHKQSESHTYYLAHLKHRRPQYVYCVHLDHNRTRKHRRNNLKRVEITITQEMLKGHISDEEPEEYEDIIPRHPYDGFYLRHRVTIDARGKKICTHEIPPQDISPPPSPAPDKMQLSDAPELIVDDEASSSEIIQEQTGVAGNLARVSSSPVEAQREAIDELARRQGWEAGNIDYMGADSFDNIWAKISQTLNQPRASPPKQVETLPVSKEEVAPAAETVNQLQEPAAEVSQDAPAVASEVTQVPVESLSQQEDSKKSEGIKTVESSSESTVSESKPVESEVKAKATQEIETAPKGTVTPSTDLSKTEEVSKPGDMSKSVDETKLAEATKLADVSTTAEAPNAAKESKINEVAMITEAGKSADESKTGAEVAKPTEESKSIEADIPKPTEVVKVAEEAARTEASKPVDVSKPIDALKVADVPKLTESVKPSEVTEPAVQLKATGASIIAQAPQSPELPKEKIKSAEVQKVSDTSKPAEVPQPKKAPKPAEPSQAPKAKESMSESPKVENKKTEPLVVPPTPPTTPKSTPEKVSPDEVIPAVQSQLPETAEEAIPESVKIAEASLAKEQTASAPLQVSDSPPLANTPSKEEASSTTAGKSEEKRRPAGKLRLSPPASAAALSTPDSEVDDAATLAHAIIAAELTPQPDQQTSPELTTGAASTGGHAAVAPAGDKLKAKPTTADCIESSVSETKSDPPKKKLVKKVVKKEATGAEAPVPPPRKKEKKPKDK